MRLLLKGSGIAFQYCLAECESIDYASSLLNYELEI